MLTLNSQISIGYAGIGSVKALAMDKPPIDHRCAQLPYALPHPRVAPIGMPVGVAG